MARRWTDDHGEPGLRDKFAVYKTKDGERHPDLAFTQYADSSRIGADGEFVFVLRPETDAAACKALIVYAGAVAPRDEQLSVDILSRLEPILTENGR